MKNKIKCILYIVYSELIVNISKYSYNFNYEPEKQEQIRKVLKYTQYIKILLILVSTVKICYNRHLRFIYYKILFQNNSSSINYCIILALVDINFF